MYLRDVINRENAVTKKTEVVVRCWCFNSNMREIMDSKYRGNWKTVRPHDNKPTL